MKWAELTICRYGKKAAVNKLCFDHIPIDQQVGTTLIVS